MTTDIIELSKKAAEVLGVSACKKWTIGYEADCGKIYNETKTKWLAEDAGRCAEIAAGRRISTNLTSPDFVETYWWTKDKRLLSAQVLLSDYNNNRLKAWRVAVLKAVIEQGEQS